MPCGCSMVLRSARKAKQKARCTQPLGTGPIQGDAAQESNSNDLAEVTSTPRDAQEIHEETNGPACVGGDQCSDNPGVVTSTPTDTQEIHEETSGPACVGGDQCSDDPGVVTSTPRDAQEIHEETSGPACVGGDQCSDDPGVVTSTPRGAQEIHEETSGPACVGDYQCSDDPGVVTCTPTDAQEIHEESNGPACVGGDQCSDELKLLPKHRIFLSHSGAQKPFVEQLCEDLENAGHFPFFDRHPDSLPKGEQFPALIMDAANQCHVAVVVLSMEYLLSKWPMIELIEFVSAIKYSSSKLKILPLFYKIGVDDLKREHDCVMSVWKERCEKDQRLQIQPAYDALRFLASINGEVFAGDSELAYRRAIVASICKLYPPDVQYDVSAMQGKDRLCQVVVAEFDKLSASGTSSHPYWRKEHARVVGVHGIGGAGKTLLCKALCNIYYADFAGRVLHIELKGYKDFKQENIIEAQKLILESLTGAGPELLRRISSVEQGNDSLKRFLPYRDVFLALDNVPEGSTEFVQNLLYCLSQGSKAIVTSRSLENLKTVLEGNFIEISPINLFWGIGSIPREKVSYIRIPTLNEDEALRIFLQHALAPARLVSPFIVEEIKVLKSCIQRCFFLNKDQPVGISDSSPVPGHYHPLSLQALGSYLKGIDAHEPLQWLHKSKILQERRWFYNASVFDILRAGYDALPSDADKLFFLDIAVFAPRGKLNNVHDLCEWLVAVHGIDEEQTLYKMKNLRRNSLIEDWEKDKNLKVTVHDLYVDFAEHQIHLEESQRWCVYERNGRTLPLCLNSAPPGLRWSSLVRLRLQTGSVISFRPEKLREWANLVVLDINLVQQKSFDISPLNCLRSLKLKSFTLKTLTWSDNMEELRSVKLSCESLVHEPDFTPCSNLRELSMRFGNPAGICLVRTLATTLKVLRLTCWSRKFPALLVLSSMPTLEVVEIVNNLEFSSGSIGIGDLSSLTHLRRLVLKNLPIRGSLAGLESLVSLEVLFLGRCSALNALPGLGTLTNLQLLDVSGTAIESLPGLENLLQLYGLYLVNCNRLKRLPDLRPFVSLKEVFLVGCTGLSRPPLVPASCTLILLSDLGDVIKSWERFIRNFSLWIQWTDKSSGPKVDFQRVLYHCPTAAALEQGLCQHKGLEEVSEAFEEAFLMMHRMAAAGRRKEEFDPDTDLIICATIVSIIPKYADHFVLRMHRKGAYDFLLSSSHLRGLLKCHKHRVWREIWGP